jgi:ABC-type glycerol-3-phosphate transport system substrate-binding protein
MRFSRRAVVRSTAGAAGALLLQACGAATGGAKPGDQPLPLEQRKPIEFEAWIGTGTDRVAQVKAWNAKYPNLKAAAAADVGGQGQKALEKFTAAIAGGSAPPVAFFDRFQVAAFAVRGVFQQLDDLAKRDRYDWKRHVEATLQEARSLDAKYYAVPCTTDVRFLYWNKELVQQAGLNADKGPTTWDEFQEYARRLTQRGGAGASGIAQLGIHPYRAQMHFNLFAWQNGGGFQTPDGKKATINRAENVDALVWMQGLAKQQGGGPTIAQFEKEQTWSGAQLPFLLNTLAMDLQTNGRLTDVARFRPDMKFGYGPPPLRKTGDKPLTWSGGHSFVIPKGYPDLDLAWKFIQFLVGEEGYTAQFEQRKADAATSGGYVLPGMTTQPEMDQKLFTKYKTNIAAIDDGLKFAVDMLKYTRIREPSVAAIDMWDAVHGNPEGAQYQAVMLEGKTAKQALDEAQTKSQKALDDAWSTVGK